MAVDDVNNMVFIFGTVKTTFNVQVGSLSAISQCSNSLLWTYQFGSSSTSSITAGIGMSIDVPNKRIYLLGSIGSNSKSNQIGTNATMFSLFSYTGSYIFSYGIGTGDA